MWRKNRNWKREVFSLETIVYDANSFATLLVEEHLLYLPVREPVREFKL